MLSAKFSSGEYGVLRFGSSPLRSFTVVKLLPPIFNRITCSFGFHAETKFSYVNSGQLQAGSITNFTSFNFQIQLITFYHGSKILKRLMKLFIYDSTLLMMNFSDNKPLT